MCAAQARPYGGEVVAGGAETVQEHNHRTGARSLPIGAARNMDDEISELSGQHERQSPSITIVEGWRIAWAGLLSYVW